MAIGTQDGEQLVVDRSEAGAVADSIVTELHSVGYRDLAARLLGEIETREATGASGAQYQVEIHGMWATGRPGPLLVIVGVDDGSLRGAFSPVDRSFLVFGDGTDELTRHG